jgi:hypothetical protein
MKGEAMVTIDLEELELADTTTAGGSIGVRAPSRRRRSRRTPTARRKSYSSSREAEARVGEEQAHLSPGHLAIVPAMEPHAVKNVGNGPLRMLGFFPSSTLVATFEEPLAPNGPQVMVVGAPEPTAPAVGEGARPSR